ncbi:Arc family DNA-binding protein [Pseudomonas sp. LMG 31766]|uniref:Arc family DNA-binding protein n=1 Tax=Pseudomonas chaetocerotis TaxID=2758695 RepID=A0A931CWX7_9PSED|nr:Arc family DNA-binding protein [Pseudomonas chaetocerotis]MBZ9665740.1 Arc family DNA-binding protein [Pseudomonas chaetocerotis]
MKQVARTQVRIPVDLMDWLKQQAQEHNRSMNSELVQLISEMKKKAA